MISPRWLLVALLLSSGRASAASWYVDSVRGDDGADGHSPSTALRSLAALMARPPSPGDWIGLARGSHFREMLTDLPANCTVAAYGTGARPLLDASDVAPNSGFTRTPGLSNVHQIQWTVTGVARYGLGGIAHRVWEGGVRLKRVPDLATCEATPGSFFAPKPTGGPDTVYVHASDGSDVSTNGKLYELAKRHWGVNAGYTGASLIGLHARRNMHRDGSIISTFYARDCVAEDGTWHNFWVTGTAEDCVSMYGEGRTQGAMNGFIAYENGDSPGATLRRCIAIGNPPSEGASYGVGFYSHTGGGGRNMRRVLYEDCTAVDWEQAWGGADADRIVLVNATAIRSSTGFQNGGNVGAVHILGGYFDLSSPSVTPVRALTSTAPATEIYGLRVTARGGSVFLLGSTVATIEQTTVVVTANRATEPVVVSVVGEGASVRFERNVVRDERGVTYTLLNAPADTAWRSDFNVLQANAGSRIGGTLHRTLADYKLATGQDQRSLTSPLTWAGSPRNGGDCRTTPGSPADTLGAGAHFHHDGIDQQEVARRLAAAIAE